jgi:hypothetical protein
MLKDDKGNSYSGREMLALTGVVGRLNARSIYPSKTESDVLLFQVPVDRFEHLDLELPSQTGGNPLRWRIPASMVH